MIREVSDFVLRKSVRHSLRLGSQKQEAINNTLSNNENQEDCYGQA